MIEISNTEKTTGLFDALMDMDDGEEGWASYRSWCVSRIVDDAMGRFIEKSKWHVGLSDEMMVMLQRILVVGQSR